MKEDKFAYNHHPEQFGVWFPYNGWRYKVHYNIRTYDGVELRNCYPNGNGWHNETGRVADSEVMEISLPDQRSCGDRYDLDNKDRVLYLKGQHSIEELPLKLKAPDGSFMYQPRLKDGI